MPNETEFVRRKLPDAKFEFEYRWPEPRKDLSAHYLRSILRYEPETGEWFWLLDRAAQDYVHTRSGDRAGYFHQSSGYIHIKINGVAYQAHRLAFLYMTGRWPKADMDHISRIRHDNRWCNLREATRSQNSMNRPRLPKASALPRGVYPHKTQFRTQFIARYAGTYLGLYKTAEQASEVREMAAKEVFGEFYHEP